MLLQLNKQYQKLINHKIKFLHFSMINCFFAVADKTTNSPTVIN
jgi:hypothetical protein